MMSSCGDSSSPGDNSPPTTISRVRRICSPSKRSASDFVELRSDDEDSENEVSFSDASTGVPHVKRPKLEQEDDIYDIDSDIDDE